MLKKVKVLLFLVSLSISLCLMSNTYSRYVADATGNVEASFAKWEILVNTNDVTDGTASTIDFTPTIEENSNVANGKVAPSSTGYFDIDINPTNVDVSFTYSIALSIDTSVVTDLKINKYAILPSNYVEGNEITFVDLIGTNINNTITYDNENPDFTGFTPFTIRIYFEWFEGVDETMDDTADTTVGNTAAIENTSFTISSTITFEQVI